MTKSFRLIACPSLSHERRQDTYFDSGRTVGDYLRELGWETDGLHARVFIDGQYVPDAEWLTAEPKPGQAVVVRRVYTGGPHNQGKQILQIVGMLAIAVGAAFAAPALTGLLAGYSGAAFTAGMWAASNAGITAGLTVAGALAMNARIPPPLPRRVAA